MNGRDLEDLCLRLLVVLYCIVFYCIVPCSVLCIVMFCVLMHCMWGYCCRALWGLLLSEIFKLGKVGWV